MDIIERVFFLFALHCLGDYVLQIDYIAKQKQVSVYHLLVHVVLYGLPFYLVFGFNWMLVFTLVTHFFVDTLKNMHKTTELQDQAIHILLLLMFYLTAPLAGPLLG